MENFPYPLPMLLDGGAATNLVNVGMPHGACMAQWANDHPDALRRVQTQFLEAGSTALLAPTFGANRAYLEEFGLAEQVEALNRRLAALTRQNAQGRLVGALVGPSGMFVPPHGQADFDDVYALYREQVRALEKAEVDFIVMASLSCLSDMRAAVLAARTSDVPIFVTMTVDETGRTVTDAQLLPTLLTLQAMGADAVGLQFSCSPDKIAPLLDEVWPHTAVPLIARPGNTDIPPEQWAAAMRRLMDAGASIVGGCLATSPAHITALHDAMAGFSPRKLPEDPDCHAATIESEAFFLSDDLTYSHPLRCTAQLPDQLIVLDDECASVTLVEIHDLEDADILAEAGHLTRQPIAVHADQLPILDAALRYYQGRLLIDTNCELERDVLLPLANKYGAILY